MGQRKEGTDVYIEGLLCAKPSCVFFICSAYKNPSYMQFLEAQIHEEDSINFTASK